jgi:hypothetical protein
MAADYRAIPRSSLDLDDELKDRRPHVRSFPYLASFNSFTTFNSLNSFTTVVRTGRRYCRPLHISIFIVLLFLLQIAFNASYASPPAFDIQPNETVFIAANIIDGPLINGAWGKSILDLVDLIGKDRVYVSIYGGPTVALKELEAKLECGKNIVSEEEDPIDLDGFTRTKLPTGESRIKRIAYLAEVRNRALKPLDTLSQRYDKLLFINDVIFKPQDATRLLWGTNVNEETGKTEYKAACGADFIKFWKFYDTFATRDNEGYSMGVPIFPWFANAGEAESRRDVLDGKSAVRVKSCWGGIVAFDARYFQRDPEVGKIGTTPPDEHTNSDPPRHVDVGQEKRADENVLQPTLPLRFRASPDPFWDASECCLIHADLMAAPSPTTPATLPPHSGFMQHAPDNKEQWGAGIYMNPYVRVAYDANTYSLLWMMKRVERLLVLPQGLINHFVHMPWFNPRRTEVAGQIVQDRLWVPSSIKKPGENDTEQAGTSLLENRGLLGRRATIGMLKGPEYWASKGHYVNYSRTAGRGGFCGIRRLLVLKEGKWGEDGGGNWDTLDVIPPLDSL